MVADHVSGLAIMLCHGSRITTHWAASYEPQVHAFKAQGIGVYCRKLSISDPKDLHISELENKDYDREPPERSHPRREDEKWVSPAVLKQLVDGGKKIMLIAHSAGGWAATEVVRPRLQAKSRASKGLAGGIIGILCESAFAIPVGESIASFLQPKDGQPLVTPSVHDFPRECLSKELRATRLASS